MSRTWSLALLGGVLLLPLPTFAAPLQAPPGPGSVLRVQKISHTQGGRGPLLDDEDQLGRSVALLGDLDGDGFPELASSGHGDDDGGLDQGAAYVLFLRQDGLVRKTQKISALEGGFTGDLDPGDQFGRSLAGIGDLDGDGVPDMAVGVNYDDDGGMNRGAVYLLTLNRDGTVKRTTKISSTQGGFVGPLRNQDEFGRSVTSPGDLDGDGVPELAVGAPTDNTGGSRRGAVWLLFLRQDGSVKRSLKIAQNSGGFNGRLRNFDWFGFSVAPLGDFDGDGVPDLLVGSALDDDGATNAGAVWLLYMNPDGTVKDTRKVSMLSGGFTGQLEYPDQFGTSVATLGDVNGDGVTDLVVGAVKDGDGGKENGAAYVLCMTSAGTVLSHQKISELEGGFPFRLDDWDWLGSSLCALGDLNRDGIPDFAIGARNDDDGGPNRGSVYLTFLRGTRAALTAGPSRGQHQPSIDPSPTATDLPHGTRVAQGRFAEPEGSLELVAGATRPGETLVFRVRVPEPLVARGALVRLLVARGLGDVAYGEVTGFLLEPSGILAARNSRARAGQTDVTIALELPDDTSLSGRPLAFQAVWDDQGERTWSDALQLILR